MGLAERPHSSTLPYVTSIPHLANWRDVVESDNAYLIHYLTEQGCEWHEIERILARLQEFDQRTMRESVFDSIEAGSFDLQALIAETREHLDSEKR